jgi:DNA-binding CsgD family transcriptional regulator
MNPNNSQQLSRPLASPAECFLRRVCGLTQAEERLSELLVRGYCLRDCAEMSGISIHTARCHLKRAMGKTRTRRQAQLVALVLRIRIAEPRL